MVARAEMLGDIGANDPSHWVDDLNPDLHAIVILFARDATERARRPRAQKLSPSATASKRLSTLDLEATPPLITRTIISATAIASRSR